MRAIFVYVQLQTVWIYPLFPGKSLRPGRCSTFGWSLGPSGFIRDVVISLEVHAKRQARLGDDVDPGSDLPVQTSKVLQVQILRISE